MQVVIGEDEALMRLGLTLVLEQGGLEVVAVAGDARTLVALAGEHRPDLVITDIRMPPDDSDDGLRAALEIRAALPAMPVLVLSQFVQRQYALELMSAGADGVGYLLKQRIADIDGFLHDIKIVAGGGTVLDREVAAAIVERASRTDVVVEALTARQREVLALMAEGNSNAAIARRLEISEKTVVQHTSLIYDRLGIAESDEHHRRVLAVVRSLAH
ncbi:MAG: response regulator transcription factor [Ilumatobacteraceae bacterium]